MAADNSSTMPRRRDRREQPADGELVRGTHYLYADEDAAVRKAAKEQRCSKAEIVRRAVRQYLHIDTTAPDR